MTQRRNVGRSRRTFTETLKRQVIDYYLSHHCSKREVWEKFIGRDEERGRILRWMRQLGYSEKIKRRPYLNVMNKDQKNSGSKDGISDKELIKELRKQLEEEKLKAIAYSKMIDIAEQELNISIRKKSDTKL